MAEYGESVKATLGQEQKIKPAVSIFWPARHGVVLLDSWQ